MRGKRILKRITALILIIGIFLSDISGSGITTDAMINTDNFVSEYGLSYEDLFDLCPSYLDNEAVETNFFDKYASYASDALAEAQQHEQSAEFFHNLKKGIAGPIKTFLGAVNITETEYEKYRKDVARKVLSDYYQTENAYQEVFTTASGNLNGLKKVYDVASDVTSFAKDIVSNYDSYDNLTLTESIVKAICDSAVIKPYLENATDAFNIVTELMTLYEIESQSVDLLIEALEIYPDTELKKGLLDVQWEIEQDPKEYILTHYVKDKVVSTIAKKIKEYTIKAVLGTSVTTLISLAKDGIVWVYELNNPSYEDIQKSYIAYTFYNETQTAVYKYKKNFKRNSYHSRDIVLYEVTYSLMISTLKILTNVAQKCVKGNDSESKSLQNLLYIASNSLGGDGITYEVYIKNCMYMAKKDIDAGNLVISKGTASTPADTPNYSSVESIKNRFAVIQSQFQPNAGVVWNPAGGWGGAIQCFGFARMVFAKLFGCEMPSYYDGYERYRYPSENNVTLISQVSGGNVTVNSVKAALQQGKLGDIIQASGSKYGQHTMVFVSADDNGVTVYDCNARPTGKEGSCLIHQWTLSWNLLVSNYGTGNSSIANGISLYRASNYEQIYGDGDGMFYDDSANFVIEDGVLTKYNGWQTYVEIPDTVTAIGDDAFRNNTRMITVSIPDSVKSIGNSAFYGCTSLIGVILPDSVESIGSSAFYNCTSLNTAVFPQNEKFEKIQSSTFYGCKALKKAEIPDGVVTIGEGAFSSCSNLCEVMLSKNTEVLGSLSFNNCKNLTQIEIPKKLKSAGAREYLGGMGWCECGPFMGCDNLKTINFEEGTTKVVSRVFAYCYGIEKIVIPDSVTVIESYAFNNCKNLKSINLSDNLLEIGVWAFYNDALLEELKLPNRLKSIGGQAFHNCISLKEIEIPKSLEVGGGYTFWGMRNYGAFDGCSNLKNIKFEEGITEIIALLFSDCTGIERIDIPDTVTSIKSSAFKGCTNLQTVNIPDTVIDIDDSAFQNCTSLSSIMIPDSVTGLGISTFAGCTNMTSVRLSKKLKRIGYGSFQNCKELTEIEIPKSLETCSYYGNEIGVFKGCTNLKSVKFEEGATWVADALLFECDGIEEIVIPESITKIGVYAFGNCVNLKNVVIPSSVTEIGYCAFQNCTSIEELVIPNNITSIASSTFSGCTALRKVELPNKIATISREAFYNCNKLELINFPSALEEILFYAFYGCESLPEVVLPEGVKEIGYNAFEKCSSLTKAVIPDSVTYLGKEAFKDCIELKEVSLGTGLTEIPQNTFYGCTVLPSVVIPYNVKKIGDCAFVNCTKLTDITIPKTTESIAENAFSYPKKLTITGELQSYAQEYASNKGIAFKEVTKDIRTSGDGIIMESTLWEVAGGLTLNTKLLKETDADYEKIDFDGMIKDSSVSAENIKFMAYYIGLVDENGNVVSPNGDVNVKIPCSEEYKSGETKVYYVNADGTFTDLQALYADGYVSMTTDAAGIYVVTKTRLRTREEMVFGDANNDGTVDSKDAVLLKKYLAGFTDLEIDLLLCDVNADGAVDSRDAVRLMKKLAGYNVELGIK